MQTRHVMLKDLTIYEQVQEGNWSSECGTGNWFAGYAPKGKQKKGHSKVISKKKFKSEVNAMSILNTILPMLREKIADLSANYNIASKNKYLLYLTNALRNSFKESTIISIYYSSTTLLDDLFYIMKTRYDAYTDDPETKTPPENYYDEYLELCETLSDLNTDNEVNMDKIKEAVKRMEIVAGQLRSGPFNDMHIVCGEIDTILYDKEGPIWASFNDRHPDTDSNVHVKLLHKLINDKSIDKFSGIHLSLIEEYVVIQDIEKD